MVVSMSDAPTEVKDAATTVATSVDAPEQEDTTSFAERYSDVLGKVNETLDSFFAPYNAQLYAWMEMQGRQFKPWD